MSIKYYHLAQNEEPPDEFCAIRDVSGEPSEYVFYVPESEVSKLRELVMDMYSQLLNAYDPKELDEFADRMRELGVEVD